MTTDRRDKNRKGRSMITPMPCRNRAAILNRRTKANTKHFIFTCSSASTALPTDNLHTFRQLALRTNTLDAEGMRQQFFTAIVAVELSFPHQRQPRRIYALFCSSLLYIYIYHTEYNGNCCAVCRVMLLPSYNAQ